MTKKICLFLALTLAVAVSLAATLSLDPTTVSAQNAVTGEWTASLDNNSRIHLSFLRRTEKGGRSNMGQTYEFSDLQGLTLDQVTNGGSVKFSLVREAGTIECEGSFQNKKGSGNFRFTPSQAFVSGMKSRGFDFEASLKEHPHGSLEDKLFTAAALNVTTALADDLNSAGFGNLDVSDLFKAAIFKIDSAYMREMKASGFPNLGMEDLVKARIFKIDAKFLAEVTQMGFDKQPFESLIQMRIFKITPQFINEVKNEGLTDLSIQDLVKLSIFKIDAEFIRKAKAEGFPLDVEKLVQRRLGVHRTSRAL